MPDESEIDCVPPLIDALSAPSLRVRSVAVRGLARRHDVRAIRPLMESVRGLESADEDEICPYVSDVMKALASCGDTGVLQPFVSLLDASFKDLYPIVWHLTEEDRSAVECMAKLYEDILNPLEEILFGPYSLDIKTCVIAILEEIDTWDADLVLVDVLQDEGMDEYLVTEAADALGRNRCEDALEPLCRILADGEGYTDDTRNSAAMALGRIGDRRGVAPLVAVLTDPNESPHYMTTDFAADALEMLVLSDEEDEETVEEESEESAEGDDDVLKILLEALTISDYSLRELAVRGLGALKDRRAVTPILESLRDWEESEDYLAFCQKAIAAVGNIGDESSVVPLFQTLNEIEHESNFFLKNYLCEQEPYDPAFQALAGMGAGIVGTLRDVVFGEYDSVIKVMAVQTLRFIRCWYAESVLIEALENMEEQDVAAFAADVLGSWGVKEAVEGLCRIICDPEEYEDVCRLHATLSLGEIGDARALGALLEVIADGDRFGERSADAYGAFESIIEKMEVRPE
jgi:HEAT repeat protein